VAEEMICENLRFSAKNRKKSQKISRKDVEEKLFLSQIN